MKNYAINLLVFCAVPLGGLLTTADAKADWYDDASSIIEQLIEDNIATQAVPNAASQLPIACEFFPSTIYAIEAKRFNGLPAVIRKEVADAVGLFVLNKINPPPAAPPAPPAAKGAVAATNTTLVAVGPAGGNVGINTTALAMLDTSAGKRTPGAASPIAMPQNVCTFPTGNRTDPTAATESKATTLSGRMQRLAEPRRSAG